MVRTMRERMATARRKVKSGQLSFFHTLWSNYLLLKKKLINLESGPLESKSSLEVPE